jgi:GTP-binding protein EngB required for normal cell division
VSEETRVPQQATVSSPALNEAQRLHLRVSCEYMDKMLREIEGILHSAEGASPFSRYRLDLSPAQGRVLEDYIRRFRAQLLRALAWQKIVPPPPGVPATRSIVTHLHFIDIAISELRPNQMRGSGALSEETAAELTGVLRELSSIAENMMRYVRDDLSESLQERAGKLIAEGKGPRVLQRIEAVVTARGLVEFRPRLDMLLARLEDATFEVAVFGRVNSGKSSFLDALLGTDLLPVGANPITAVPTRVQYGERIAAKVRLGNGAATEVPVERFRELISETGNPGNREGVRYAQLMIPSARLSEGIVLVDTPGLGSLALRGAEETLAYLPSCDLAVVLIDAGSSLTLEDVGTLRLVLEAGIPAIVLLSKADLLREEERRASVEYIRAQIERELRATVPIHAVSSIGELKMTIDEFYGEELEPRFRQSHELRQRSVHAKLSRLQQDVLAALGARLHRAETPAVDAAAVPSMEKTLMDAAGGIGVLDRTLEERVLALGFEAPALMSRAARESVAALDDSRGCSD